MPLGPLSLEACEIEAMAAMAGFEALARERNEPLAEVTNFDLETLVERVRELKRLFPQGAEVPVPDFLGQTADGDFPTVIGVVKGDFTICPDGRALVRVCFRRAGKKRESGVVLEVSYPIPQSSIELREKALIRQANAAPAST